MRIETDDEGRKIIQSLCGVVIEALGGRAIPIVNAVLSNIKNEVPVSKKVEKKMKGKKAENPSAEVK